MKRDEFEQLPVWVKNAAIAIVAHRHYGPTIPDGPMSLPSKEVTVAAVIIFETYELLREPLVEPQHKAYLN